MIGNYRFPSLKNYKHSFPLTPTTQSLLIGSVSSKATLNFNFY